MFTVSVRLTVMPPEHLPQGLATQEVGQQQITGILRTRLREADVIVFSKVTPTWMRRCANRSS